MPAIAEAKVRLRLLQRRFRQNVRRVEGRLDGLKERMQGVSRTARNMLIGGGLGLGAAIREAGQAESVMARFRQVFGDQTEEARRFAEEFAASLKRSKFAVADNLTVFQNFFLGLEVGRDRARELSQQMVTLATDFAAFNNLSQQEAVERFISALSGSAEVMDRFGVNLRAARLEQELMRMGIDKSTAQASEQAKALARVNVILQSMTRQGAIGQAEREVNQFNERLKQLRDQVQLAAVKIGRAFLPVARRVVGAVSDILPNIGLWISQNQRLIVGLAKWGAIVGSTLFVLPRLIGTMKALISVWRAGTAALASLRAMAISTKAALIGTGAGALALAATLIADAFMRVKTSFEQASDAMLKFQQNASNFKSAIEAMTDAQRRFRTALEAGNTAAQTQQLDRQVRAMRRMLDAIKEARQEGGLEQIFGKRGDDGQFGIGNAAAALRGFLGPRGNVQQALAQSSFNDPLGLKDTGVTLDEITDLIRGRLRDVQQQLDKAKDATAAAADQTEGEADRMTRSWQRVGQAIGGAVNRIRDFMRRQRQLAEERRGLRDRLRLMERSGAERAVERLRQQRRDMIERARELGLGRQFIERIRREFRSRILLEQHKAAGSKGDGKGRGAGDRARTAVRAASQLVGGQQQFRRLLTAAVGGRSPEAEAARAAKKTQENTKRHARTAEEQRKLLAAINDNIQSLVDAGGPATTFGP